MIRTKSAQTVKARTGETAIIKASITQIDVNEERYLVIGSYESISIEGEGDEATEVLTQIDSFRREIPLADVDTLYEACKGMIKSTNFTGIFNELKVLSLMNIVGEEANWGLTASDWEAEKA